jgi:uncharacterized protein
MYQDYNQRRQPQPFRGRGYAQAGDGYGAAVDHVGSRDKFIARTYNHLFGAIVLFSLLEVALFKSGIADRLAAFMLGGRYTWLMVMGGFMVVGWLASRTAHTSTSKATQYLALGGFVAAEAIVFVPLLWMANVFAPGAIQSAAAVTMVGFAGLTGIAFWTRKDFSFLGAILRWVGFGVLLLIGASLIFGFTLGTLFSVGMVVFAGAAILYDTSNVLHHFPTDRYVGAALQLFASVALMFWYVIQLFMGSRR